MDDLDNLLVDALNSELEAKKFYQNAALKAQSQAGKMLFKELAEFENNHYKRVNEIIESRINKINIDKPMDKHDNIKINSEVDGEFEPNKDEIVTIINLAIDAEKKAQERYEKIANLFDEDEIKQIFISLSFEERNHQKILEDEFYHLSNKGTIIWD